MSYNEFLNLAGLSSKLCTLMEYTQYIEPAYSNSTLEKEKWWLTNGVVIIMFLLRQRGRENSLLKEEIDFLTCELDRQEKILQKLKDSLESEKEAVIEESEDIIDVLKEEKND